MKRLFRNIILMAMAAAAATGCHFLEVEQVGKSDIEGYFSEPAAVPAAIYGLSSLTYALLDKYLISYPEIAGDELVLRTTEATWDLYQNYATTADDETGAIGYIWKNGYQVINNANQIIDHVPALVRDYPNDADELNTCAAQALFIRAYTHLGICLTFGQNYTFTPDASHLGICVITHALSLNDLPARQSVKEVYTQVLKDLEESLKLYPEGHVFNRFLPSPLASEALLARVYLYMGEWAKAAEYASKVIAKTTLTKRDSYVAMFNAMKEPAEDEMIYTLNGQKQGSSMYKLYWKKEPKARPSSMVRDLLPEGDIRAQVLELDGESVCLKFEQNDGESDPYSNIPVFRASEMYLIRAEANLMLHKAAEAIADIEVLQSRAMGTDVKLGALTEEELDRVIEQERIKELCFEGHRLWDITRRHKNLVRPADHTATLKELSYPDYRFVLQIPSTEMEANTNLVNNPTSNE